MKKTLIAATVTFLLAAGGLTAYAQMPEGQGGGQGGQMGRDSRLPMSVDQRLQMLTRQLNLTSDQQKQIKPILENQQQQMDSLHQDSSMSDQDRMAKMKSLHEQTIAQIKPILNTEQQEKFQQMTSQHGRGHGMGMGHGQGSAAGQPPPTSN